MLMSVEKYLVCYPSRISVKMMGWGELDLVTSCLLAYCCDSFYFHPSLKEAQMMKLLDWYKKWVVLSNEWWISISLLDNLANDMSENSRWGKRRVTNIELGTSSYDVEFNYDTTSSIFNNGKHSAKGENQVNFMIC